MTSVETFQPPFDWVPLPAKSGASERLPADMVDHLRTLSDKIWSVGTVPPARLATFGDDLIYASDDGVLVNGAPVMSPCTEPALEVFFNGVKMEYDASPAPKYMYCGAQFARLLDRQLKWMAVQARIRHVRKWKHCYRHGMPLPA